MAMRTETGKFLQGIFSSSLGLWVLLIVGQTLVIYRIQDPQRLYGGLAIASALASTFVVSAIAWLRVDESDGPFEIFSLRWVSFSLIFGALLLGGLGQILVTALGIMSEGEVHELCNGQGQYWLLMATSVVVSPIMEEAIFRGYLISSGQRAGMNHAFLVFLAAVPWAWVHERESWVQLMSIYLFGVLLGFVRISTGSVVPAMAAHIGWNAVFLAGFVLECAAVS